MEKLKIISVIFILLILNLSGCLNGEEKKEIDYLYNSWKVVDSQTEGEGSIWTFYENNSVIKLKGLGSEFIWEKFIVDGNRIGFSTLGSEQITDWYDYEFKHEFLYLVISQNNNMTLLEKVT